MRDSQRGHERKNLVSVYQESVYSGGEGKGRVGGPVKGRDSFKFYEPSFTDHSVSSTKKGSRLTILLR